MSRLPLVAGFGDALTRRIFLYLAIPMLLICLGFAGAHLFGMQRRLTQEFVAHARAQAALFVHAARIPLFAGDRGALDSLSQGLLDDRSFLSVRVFDSQGQLLLQTDGRSTGPLPDTWMRSTPAGAAVAEGPEFLEFWLVVPGSTGYRDDEALYFEPEDGRDGGDPIGTIGVLASRAVVREAVAAGTLRYGMLTLLFLVLAGAVALAVVAEATRPLRGLLEQIQGRDSPPRPGRESSWVTDRHASLISQLDESFETIRRLNAELEGRVAERTRKLSAANAELQRARDHLEERVQERTEALAHTHAQLRHAEKLSAIGRLASSLAHELNNPICGVRNCIEELRYGLPVASEEAEIADLALAECDRMAALVSSLRRFSRPSSDRVEPVMLPTLLDALLRLTHKQFDGGGIRVVAEYAPDLSPVSAAGDQLKQVFLNLLQNARDAMDGGGGTVTLRARQTGGEVVVEIADQGAGIAPENLEKIFEPFFSTKDAVKGTGLGLSVSHGIVERLGGRIEVESTLGRGSTFTVCLPAMEELA
ncbi:MAG: ATP-binding protein [Deferrisomatales bacterium]|nr:ATP-binding protein [Deferrisomatales bacterium]